MGKAYAFSMKQMAKHFRHYLCFIKMFHLASMLFELKNHVFVNHMRVKRHQNQNWTDDYPSASISFARLFLQERCWIREIFPLREMPSQSMSNYRESTLMLQLKKMKQYHIMPMPIERSVFQLLVFLMVWLFTIHHKIQYVTN